MNESEKEEIEIANLLKLVRIFPESLQTYERCRRYPVEQIIIEGSQEGIILEPVC